MGTEVAALVKNVREQEEIYDGPKSLAVVVPERLSTVLTGAMFPITVKVVEVSSTKHVPILTVMVQFDTKNFGIKSPITVPVARGGMRNDAKILIVAGLFGLTQHGQTFQNIVPARGITKRLVKIYIAGRKWKSTATGMTHPNTAKYVRVGTKSSVSLVDALMLFGFIANGIILQDGVMNAKRMALEENSGKQRITIPMRVILKENPPSNILRIKTAGTIHIMILILVVRVFVPETKRNKL